MRRGEQTDQSNKNRGKHSGADGHPGDRERIGNMIVEIATDGKDRNDGNDVNEEDPVSEKKRRNRGIALAAVVVLLPLLVILLFSARSCTESGREQVAKGKQVIPTERNAQAIEVPAPRADDTVPGGGPDAPLPLAPVE